MAQVFLDKSKQALSLPENQSLRSRSFLCFPRAQGSHPTQKHANHMCLRSKIPAAFTCTSLAPLPASSICARARCRTRVRRVSIRVASGLTAGGDVMHTAPALNKALKDTASRISLRLLCLLAHRHGSRSRFSSQAGKLGLESD